MWQVEIHPEVYEELEEEKILAFSCHLIFCPSRQKKFF